MKVLGLHLVAFMLVLASTTAAYRLPTTVVPVSYEVHLTLPAEAFTADSDAYEGYELITIRTTSSVTEIKLHAAHDFINIISAHINNADITNISTDNSTDIITLGGFSLPANFNGLLYIFFTSRLSTQDMYGFYKSSYTVGGETRYLATTQFQPIFARRAFPCFDEPSFKAVFDIYISNPRSLTALSNMPGQDYDASDIVGNNPNLTTTHFPTTGVMSSYLVAIVVSDLTCSSGQNIEISAVPYRVCSTAQTNLTRDLALDAGVTLLRSLNTYTDYPYSTMGFSKMDQIAIPDFAAGAMENWGLVTYREQLLLWDSVESTNMDQQQIATIISHEYAHQWWGNLVTMEWWSETFLNEGFATYFQYFTTHEVYPSWELDKQWVIRVLQGILESDSLTSSPALQAPANSDAQVMARFAQVSYLKGGVIFRMAEHILGPDNFKEGLRSYLKKFEFQTTLPDDLWNSLDETLTNTNNRSRLPSNTSLSTVMRNWVESPGYPILDLTFVQFAVVVTQEGRFLLNGNDTTSRWYIPITYATNVNPNFENTLAQDWLLPVGFVEIPFLTTHNWIVLNNYATGYYRVNYNNLWDPLIVALQDPEFSGIPDVNRAAFVDDAFHLARADKLNYTRTFDIISFLTNDTSYYPWFRAINGFNFLLRRVGQDSRLGQAMSEHVLDLLANVYASVPWTNLNSSDHVYTLKQIDVLSMACRLGLPNCVQHALERFGDFRISGNRPTQNIRSIVYCNALRYGNNSADWNLLWNAFTTSQLASDRVRILSALGCTNDEEILERYLHLSLNENSGIRSQDALSVFTAVYTGSPKGLDVAFRFLQENHALIDERYASLNALTNMIVGLAGWFTTEAQVVQLRNFTSTGGLHEDFQNAANSALATAEANLLWLEKYSEELHRYYGLEMEVPEPQPSSSSISPNISSSTEPPLTTVPGDGAGAITASISLIVLSIAFALRS